MTRYKIRAGIEGTNSGLKRKTGLRQLRAAVCAKMRQIVRERASRSIFGQILAISMSRMTIQSVCIGSKTEITAYLQRCGELPPLHVAA
ncbi:MAG: hypothetical protein PHF37_09220 [Phycisphaerae bacterium]|nr:hypothetical protein [Phycisphaerae bacterium]